MNEISKFCDILQSHKRVGFREWLWQAPPGQGHHVKTPDLRSQMSTVLTFGTFCLSCFEGLLSTPPDGLCLKPTPDLRLGHAQVHSCCYEDILGLLAEGLAGKSGTARQMASGQNLTPDPRPCFTGTHGGGGEATTQGNRFTEAQSRQITLFRSTMSSLGTSTQGPSDNLYLFRRGPGDH